MSSTSRESIDKSFAESDDESGMTLIGEKRMRDSFTKPRRDVIGRLLKLFLAAVALVCAATMVYTAVGVHRLASVTTTEYGDCGSSNTVEEARALGCVFDPMSWIWVRPECYDADLVADFFNQTDFSWHTDPKLKPESKLSMDVIFSGEHPKLFTQKEYHTVHCFYMMKKMHRAMLEHTPIDSYLTEWQHTNHCGMVMMNDIMHQDVQCTAEMVCPTWVRATWTACRRY